MDIVEQKLQEIKDYFIDKVVKGEYLIGIMHSVSNSKLMKATLVVDDQYNVDTLVDIKREILFIATVSKENNFKNYEYFPVICGFKMTEDQQKKAYRGYYN